MKGVSLAVDVTTFQLTIYSEELIKVGVRHSDQNTFRKGHRPLISLPEISLSHPL